MYILGISAFYHDSAAALIHDGDIVSAVQEERFTRIKHYSSFWIYFKIYFSSRFVEYRKKNVKTFKINTK
tara:strand:+ start:2152 stop:2361 length:210 start_codon:yes stop_codon:yes gene_type:complete